MSSKVIMPLPSLRLYHCSLLPQQASRLAKCARRRTRRRRRAEEGIFLLLLFLDTIEGPRAPA
jgi:hypothetical protein